MVKKILIGASVLVIVFGAVIIYLNYRNRTLSPPGSASVSNGDLTVSVSYSRQGPTDFRYRSGKCFTALWRILEAWGKRIN
jgi:hypothetical protein